MAAKPHNTLKKVLKNLTMYDILQHRMFEILKRLKNHNHINNSQKYTIY